MTFTADSHSQPADKKPVSLTKETLAKCVADGIDKGLEQAIKDNPEGLRRFPEIYRFFRALSKINHDIAAGKTGRQKQ